MSRTVSETVLSLVWERHLRPFTRFKYPKQRATLKANLRGFNCQNEEVKEILKGTVEIESLTSSKAFLDLEKFLEFVYPTHRVLGVRGGLGNEI